MAGASRYVADCFAGSFCVAWAALRRVLNAKFFDTRYGDNGDIATKARKVLLRDISEHAILGFG